MAIAFGSSGAAASSATNVSVPYPASIAANDLLVLTAVTKFNPNAPTSPSSPWVLQGQVSGGSGADGADVGTIITSVWTKVAVGTESGNLTLAVHASNNVTLARMHRYTKAADRGWNITATTGADNTAGTSWSVTGAANPGITASDVVLVTSGTNTDAYTYSSEAVSATGISAWGTMTERQDSGTTTGSDVALVMSEHPVTTGTASAAPVFTMTASGTATNNPAGSTVFLRLRENVPPTTVLNSPADASSNSDTTPTLDFTGTDPDGDSIEYQVQVDTVNTFDSIDGGSGIVDSYSEANQNSDSNILSSAGNDGLGQSITGDGNVLNTIQFYLKYSSACTGNIKARVYTHSGTFGTSSVPTGAALAASDNFDSATITSSFALRTFIFSGANQITLTNGTNYVITLEDVGLTAGVINFGIDTTSPTHAGNRCQKFAGGAWAAVSTNDSIFYVYTTIPPDLPLLNKVSETDAGFVNPDTGGDTHPFNSGENIQYTVQAGDALAAGTYYWHVRGKDPAGSNTYGAWATTRSFTVTVAGGNTSNFFQFFP